MLLFLLGFVAIVVATLVRGYHSDEQLLRHCININRGELLPYPNGCAKPVAIVKDVLVFINTQGYEEHYVVVRLRGGGYHYYEINKS